MGLLGLLGLNPDANDENPQNLSRVPTQGMPNNELLAGILLSLGESMGGKTPAFLTNELQTRSRARLNEQSAQRILERQEVGARRAEDYKQAAEQRKATLSREKESRASQAMLDVEHDYMQAGAQEVDKAMEPSVRLRYLRHLVGQGVPMNDAVKYVEGMKRKWTWVPERGGFSISDPMTGVELGFAPRKLVETIGNTKITREGTNVVGEYTPTERRTLGPQQGVVELPASGLGSMTPQVPGSQSGLVPTGSVTPASGVTLAQQARTGPRTLVEPMAQETPLSTEQRGVLAGSKYANVRTFEELARTPGGGEFFNQKRQEIKDTEDERRARLAGDRAAAQIEATLRGKARAPIGKRALNYIHTTTLQSPSGLTATEDVEGDSDWVQLRPETIKAVQGLPVIKNNFDELEEIIRRRTDLFPRSTGKKAVDAAAQKYSRAKAWAVGTADPDIARLKALELQVPIMIKNYGDTGNIAVPERLIAKDALGLHPDIAESVLARLNVFRRGLNASLGPLKIAPYFQIFPETVPGSPKPGGGAYNNRSFGGN